MPATPMYDETTPSGRIWFGLTSAAVAWVLQGTLGTILVGLRCDVGPAAHTPGGGVRTLVSILSLALLALAVAAGVISYRTWRLAARERALSRAEGLTRHEFLSLTGVFVSTALGIGVVWGLLATVFLRCELMR